LKNTKKKIGYIIILFLISASTFQILNMNTTKNFKEGNNYEQVQTSAQESHTKQWIENPFFTSAENWTLSKGDRGDPKDVDANISEEQANYLVIGDRGRKEVILDATTYGKWEAFNKTDDPLVPNNGYEVDSDGVNCSHLWDDNDADQTPIIYWRTNVSMGINMSDYQITSASLEATMNASVHNDIDVESDTYSVPDNFWDLDQRASYDFAQFFIEVADMEVTELNTYELGFNQTQTLGEESTSNYDIEGPIEIKNEQAIIDSLTNVLDVDPDHDNFTLILGIYIYCADNYNSRDEDSWLALQIKYVNLTFTYERKIDQLTSVSWNQEGDKPSDISTDTVVVDEAILNFKYMINDTWPSSSSNSEIQVFINGMKHSEAINLLDEANTTFQYVKLGGFDVTYLIEEDKNINLSIQVYLADDFELNRTIAISIDNVSLDISYTVYFANYQTNLQLFLNGDDKTLSPSIELPIGQNLTVTVKYTNQTGGHIPGAEIQLTGVGIIETLDENANNYSVTINATQKLSLGTNYLNIEAKKTNYETQPINPTITIRKILGEIRTISGVATINIDVGQNAQLEIMLNDTDNDELIRGAIVTYTWDRDSIPRVLTETNGIYEGEIVNPPEGLYTITISVFAGEDYEFEDLPITLNVGAYVPGAQPDLGWLIYVLIGGIVGLVVVFTLYQTHFKYPPMVRKIRKLKKNVKKAKKTKPILVNKRDELIEASIQNQISILEFEPIEPEKKGMIDKIPLDKEGT